MWNLMAIPHEGSSNSEYVTLGYRIENRKHTSSIPGNLFKETTANYKSICFNLKYLFLM